MRDELYWWIKNTTADTFKLIDSVEPELEIFTDASLLGWGAVCNGVESNGPWTVEDSMKHINELELMATFNGLCALRKRVITTQ